MWFKRISAFKYRIVACLPPSRSHTHTNQTLYCHWEIHALVNFRCTFSCSFLPFLFFFLCTHVSFTQTCFLPLCVYVNGFTVHSHSTDGKYACKQAFCHIFLIVFLQCGTNFRFVRNERKAMKWNDTRYWMPTHDKLEWWFLTMEWVTFFVGDDFYSSLVVRIEGIKCTNEHKQSIVDTQFIVVVVFFVTRTESNLNHLIHKLGAKYNIETFPKTRVPVNIFFSPFLFTFIYFENIDFFPCNLYVYYFAVVFFRGRIE